ncbi:AP-4 complex accessory subunit Tepsin [Trichomycterus rosablanca]|uniref:AP-4 complex accessory subunit Tepsin n=1 Tax=Trichomycterus rosablanca TaxID=2290929 RepID=UPI002F35CCF4
MATLMERLAFLQKVPTLIKATADDEVPCPGYLFEEFSKISHESVGFCQCLLEYLLERLQVESCFVKIKVLKILLHLSGHSPPNFLTELRRNASFIQEVTVYSGPPDPIHGNALYQKVRLSAQELTSVLFNDIMSMDSGVSSSKPATPNMGMGSECLQTGMQGFGSNPERKLPSGVTLLDKIQKAAEVVASAVLPPREHAGIRLHDNHYRAVVAPSAAVEVAVPACAYNVPSHSRKAFSRCPGQVSGGWEETCSGSSHKSSFENAPLSHTSMRGSSKSGETGSHSGASRESGDGGSESVDAMQLGDCGQEMTLINSLTAGSKIFLSKDESQHFIKECSTLNCEVVVELLSRKLKDPTQTVQMRSLCGLACLMCSDLIPLEHIFTITRVNLTQLSEESSGTVTNKATKLLRQFKALLGTAQSVTKHEFTEPPESSSPSCSGQPPHLPFTSPLLPTPLDSTASPCTTVKQLPSTNDSQPPSAGQVGHGKVQHDSAQETGLEEGVQEEHSVPGNADRTTDPCKVSETSTYHPTLSLFSGMDLINRGKPVCLVEPVPMEPDSQTEEKLFTYTGVNKEKHFERTTQTSASASNELSSAFSFLNL